MTIFTEYEIDFTEIDCRCDQKSDLFMDESESVTAVFVKGCYHNVLSIGQAAEPATATSALSAIFPTYFFSWYLDAHDDLVRKGNIKLSPSFAEAPDDYLRAQFMTRNQILSSEFNPEGLTFTHSPYMHGFSTQVEPFIQKGEVKIGRRPNVTLMPQTQIPTANILRWVAECSIRMRGSEGLNWIVGHKQANSTHSGNPSPRTNIISG